MNDTIGAVLLGILAVILLIGWRRAETRYRKLIDQGKIPEEKLMPDIS